MAVKNFWRIVGYDSTEKIFERDVPYGAFSEKQMENVLRVMVARAGLTYDEILDCHARRNTKLYRNLLEVQVNSNGKFSMTCGLNPHFIASVVDKQI